MIYTLVAGTIVVVLLVLLLYVVINFVVKVFA